jgi:hypothetical protein
MAEKLFSSAFESSLEGAARELGLLAQFRMAA